MKEKERVPPNRKRNKRKSEKETKQHSTAVKFNESFFYINMEIKEADFPIDTQMQENEGKEEITEEQMQEADSEVVLSGQYNNATGMIEVDVGETDDYA